MPKLGLIVISLFLSLRATANCELNRVPINLFQIHSTMSEDWQCLLVKTKAEANYIAHGIPSNEIPLYQDQLPWTSFDFYRFCYDPEDKGKLRALLDELDEEDYLDYNPWIGNNQGGILSFLIPNISRAMHRRHKIRNSGPFYYSLFEERSCPNESNPSESLFEYDPSEISAHESRMEDYHNLIRILTRHFEAVERHSFLPSELEELN